MNKSIKIIINYLLGPALFLILSWTLYRQVLRQPDLPQRWDDIRIGWNSPLFWIAVLLMPVNWGLESLKWKMLLSHLEQVSFLRAFKSVLAGTSITMLTPNRIGEYAGRIMYVHEGHRITAISLTILGSTAQLLVTLVMGCAGLLVFRNGLYPVLPEPGLWVNILGNVLFFTSLLTALLTALLFFRIRLIIQWLEKTRFLKKFVKHITVLEGFSRKQLLRILILSFIRYIVFILQYVLLLELFDAGIPLFWAFWLLTVFYLLMTAVPSIGLSELPLRASASVEIFRAFSQNAVAIQASAFGIWIINLAVPALVGSLLILGLKILKDK